jgi:hypothetical protein
MAKRRPKPKRQPTHITLKPDGGDKYKGSYYRRIEDIEKGLAKISKYKLPEGGQFLFLYYGCEKLAKCIVGISEEWDAEEAANRSLILPDLKAAASGMKLPVTDRELDALLETTGKKSARHWRNEIVHNFGPSNVSNIVKHGAKLNAPMRKFLDACTPAVLKYLKTNYSHLLP